MKDKLFLILIITFLFSANFVLAAGNYYYKSIDVDISVNIDSTFDVSEKQTYNLDGNFGYFYRDIDLKRLDHISDISAFDESGNKIEPKILNKGNKVRVEWDFDRRDFSNELKSWTIKYKVHGGLGFYKNYDEIYWNAIFSDRDVSVESANVTVHLPGKMISAEDYLGILGSKYQPKSFKIIDDKTIKFQAENIAPQESYTIVATWPKGIVLKPFLYRDQIINLLALLAAILIPVIVFIKAYRTWKKFGKDPKMAKTIISQYEPPDNLLPAMTGVLIKQNADIKEILATVINLAVRGYIRIKEEENKILFFRNKQYTFEKLKSWGGLKLFEQKIMESIFKRKTLVSSSELKNEFYKHIPVIKKAMYAEMGKESGYFNGNIQSTRRKYSLRYLAASLAVIPVAIVFFIISNLFLINILAIAFLLIISLIVSFAIGLAFSYYMPTLTMAGLEAKWKALGFKEYLHTAERFRIGAETLDTFSKFLAYAMIFGVEKQWAERFSDFKYENQAWYIPYASSGLMSAGTEFPMSDFSSNFSAFASSISSSFSSSPGGSGAGGAGGAGGGGGGGGGGAG